MESNIYESHLSKYHIKCFPYLCQHSRCSIAHVINLRVFKLFHSHSMFSRCQIRVDFFALHIMVRDSSVIREHECMGIQRNFARFLMTIYFYYPFNHICLQTHLLSLRKMSIITINNQNWSFDFIPNLDCEWNSTFGTLAFGTRAHPSAPSPYGPQCSSDDDDDDDFYWS